jgi:hypothetical protein
LMQLICTCSAAPVSSRSSRLRHDRSPANPRFRQYQRVSAGLQHTLIALLSRIVDGRIAVVQANPTRAGIGCVNRLVVGRTFFRRAEACRRSRRPTPLNRSNGSFHRLPNMPQCRRLSCRCRKASGRIDKSNPRLHYPQGLWSSYNCPGTSSWICWTARRRRRLY